MIVVVVDDDVGAAVVVLDAGRIVGSKRLPLVLGKLLLPMIPSMQLGW